MAKTTKENKKRKQRKVIIDDKRISINFYTEREFQEKYRKLLTQEEERKKITFKKIAEAWQNQHYETIEEYTQNCYDAPVKDAISWFGNRLVNDIKPTDIQDRINQMYMQGYAKQTIKLRRIVLNMIFDHAVLNDYLTSNPVDSVRIPKGAPVKKRELPEESDLLTILEAVNHPFGLYNLLAATTGARRGEICALTKDDFDFENDEIRIEKVCIMGKNTKPIIKQRTKSESGVRTVPILPAVKHIIKRFVENCDCDYVINYKGQPLVKWQFDKLATKYKEDTGVKFTSHQLRHLYATLCFDADLAAKDTQVLLGHSKVSTTQDIYIHIRDARKQAVNTKLKKKINDKFVKDIEEAKKEKIKKIG